MKYLKLYSVFLMLIMLMNVNIFSQETVSPYKGSIIAGTNRMFIISFNKQQTVKAKILSINGDEITIKDKKGNTREVDRNTITKIEQIPFGTLGTVGIGLGVPYGILGFNLEFNVLPVLSVTGGLGTTMFVGIGYNVGLKGYFRKPGPVWRPRVSAYYGINGMYAEDFNDPDNEKYSGLTIGVGQIFLWQQHGFDLDLMYVATSNMPEELDSGSNIKISFGYRFAF